jgi:hypothetical protein
VIEGMKTTIPLHQKASGRSRFPEWHDYTIKWLEEWLALHYDISRFRSKSWDEFAGPDAPHMDFIITVCDNAAGEVCPVWPGKPVSAHWGLPDPAAATGSEAEIAAAFQQCYGQLHHRISLFAALPIASLEQVALKHELDAIGRSVKQ